MKRLLLGGALGLLSISWGQEIILRRVQKTAALTPSSQRNEVSTPLYLKGRVLDAKSREPLIGAYARIPGSIIGAITDSKGEFRIPTTLTDPVVVEVSYIGYQTQQVTIAPAGEQSPFKEILLQEEEIVGQEVIISASRVEEQFMRTPIQVSQLSSLALRTSPGILSAQTLSFLPGVDVVYTSFTFPVVNARGFNFTQNPRFINRVDGVEMQSTALNIPVLTFTAPPEIDVANVEVIAGPASALYGPNAFNGVMLTSLKDPFQYPGLSGYVRLGINHIGESERGRPAPLYDLQARYAKSWNNRWGLKVVLHGLLGEDWWATDRSDRGVYAGAQPPYSTPGPENPGYVPVNGYGYDARAFLHNLPLTFFDGRPIPAFYLSRTGYMESELISTRMQIGKVTGGLFYRFTDQLMGQITFHVANGRTIYQANTRYALQDFVYQGYKAELTHSRGFLRLYTLHENGGRSMPLGILGANLLNVVKPHTDWFRHYLLAYAGFIDGSISPQDRAAFEAHYGRPVPQMGDHAAARWLADSDTRFLATLPSVARVASFLPGGRWDVGTARPAPNTPELRRLVDSLARIPVTKGGALLVDRCALHHAEAQYELPSVWSLQTIVGGSFRLFEIDSRGTIFADTLGRPIYNWEAGAYLQTRRGFVQDRLQLTLGARYDYRQYLVGQVTPRAALSWSWDRKSNHVSRFTYQMGFRNPINEALFINLQTDARLIGALPQTDKALGIAGTNNYTKSSVEAFQTARAQGIPIEEAAKLLRSVPIDGLRPEKVQSFEVGTRHLLLDQKLLIDITYAYQRYKDFHGNLRLYGPADKVSKLTPQDVEDNRLSPLYGRYYNIPGTPQAQFLTIALQYRATRYLLLYANYGYAHAWGLEEAKALDPGLNIFFNTSPHRVNAGIHLQNLGRWNAQLWYQWVHAYLFEFPNYEGIVPTYNLLHAQVSYRLPKWHSEVRIGAQNLLNFYHIQVPGGPRIGGVYYIQYSFDPLSL
ncbi:MAG: carboxypeptidase-like regulatory domain-containing protein [Bacteroidia bacterium]|nr:carboxypeptidase-like regulatory domain-containing protein [Bacteroidia bacterium]MDW8056945.1 carboxypeptidase-like regulatory domain-containing protein [Bacteroidia bacterium]